MRTHSVPRSFEIIAANLSGWPDPSVPIAASRAGATGVLTLDETVDRATARLAMTQLVQHAGNRYGLKLRADSTARTLLADGPRSLDVLILTEVGVSGFADAVRAGQQSAKRVLAEVTNIGDARLALELGVHGLVAKGHEAGGFVGEETTFVLVQRLLSETGVPVWAYGGIGLHTAPACYVAGCAGVMLDAQFALTTESRIPTRLAGALQRMAGDETLCLGNDLGDRFRLYRRPAMAGVDALQRLEQSLLSTPPDEARHQWRSGIRERLGWEYPESNVWALGQDASFASSLQKRFQNVAGIVAAIRAACDEHVALAREQKALDRHAPLAQSHRTEFPILQGPMTRVSDTPEFAEAVARNGALPFLALALLRGPQVKDLLEGTRERLGDRPWGVGILGFVPHELRREQLDVIEQVRPPFAIIAGGRPDQASRLESCGIATYLHVPAPGLLKVFLEDGARRFIFEGRECGGHVGPRTSFVLWQAMIDALLDATDAGIPAGDLHVVFAGGIHDARSAAMVATMAAPLVARGVRIGVLLGTAYLFTEEAVEGRAIVAQFQREALECTDTVLLETGPGHSTRCVPTPFYNTFVSTKRQLVDAGKPAEDIRAELEQLNLGRLRLASKGIVRETQANGEPRYAAVDAGRQCSDGMYMIGQVAALRAATCRMNDLHVSVCPDSVALLSSLPVAASPKKSAAREPKPCDIAIVGMGCLLPGAQNINAFWANVLNKVDVIREIPKDRFDADLYFDPDRHARDKIYSRWGGFLEDVPFDPLRYGIPPASLPSIDPFQLLALEVVHQALDDAGYLNRSFPKAHTSVILGASGGLGDLGAHYGLRSALPLIAPALSPAIVDLLPEWTEDSFAGLLLNVAAGRVANRFDLGGVNFTVDAACASSLAAIAMATRELESGTSDVVIAGGVDTVQNPFGYLCFSKSQALSPRGRCSTFDEDADGIVISEGLAAVVLKRLGDAERDGDRIYAVIKAVAGSSDGRAKGMTAPRPEGQMVALERAYRRAGVDPSTIGLVEGHGTGTVAGDAAEVGALSSVFGAAGSPPAGAALGSVKSMIGHTKATAGVAGLIKVALALHHKVLPPTMNVKKPNPKLREPGNPFFVNTEALPWAAPADGLPRRAGVSSFGFGGTNFHAVVEENPAEVGIPSDRPGCVVWPAELFVWTAPSSAALSETLQTLRLALTHMASVPVRELAAATARRASTGKPSPVRLSIVAGTHDDLTLKIGIALDALAASQTEFADARGVYLASGAPVGKIAFVFPGQGSQYPHMLRNLAIYFPEIRERLELADRELAREFPRLLSRQIYGPPLFDKAEHDARMRALTDTAVAQPALGAVETGLVDALRRLGVQPDMAAGHSYGEYVALYAAGVLSASALIRLSQQRGAIIKDACQEESGTMSAVDAGPDDLARAIGEIPGLWIANLNAPRQTIIAGTNDGVAEGERRLAAQGFNARRIPVACAFHSPLMEPPSARFAAVLAESSFTAPRFPVYSNSRVSPYPSDQASIAEILTEHMTRPVRFAEQVCAMYDSGARVFVEVGPRSVLSGLVRQTLADRKAVVLTIDDPEDGVTRLVQVLAQLVVHGASVDLEQLFALRSSAAVDLDALMAAKAPEPSWLVNGGHARPRSAALKARLDPKSVFPNAASPAPAVSVPPPVPVAASAIASTRVVTAASPDRPERPAPRGKGTLEAPVKRANGEPQPDSDGMSSGIAAGGEDDVMLQFQQLMSQFLRTQSAVMLAYLQRSSGQPGQTHVMRPMLEQSSVVEYEQPAPPKSRLVARNPVPTPEPVARPAAAAAPRPQPARSRSAAAPRISLTPIATPTVRAAAPAVVPPPAPAAPATSAPATASLAKAKRDLQAELLQIVSDRTGYPKDMLDLDLNIEADLGIDSIKRVEILAAFQRLCSDAQRAKLQDAMETITAVKTLRATAKALDELLGDSSNGNQSGAGAS